MPRAQHTAADQTSGLAYWMEQVLKEADKVAAGFSPDCVHDLRVALRRCRSMADGIRALDPCRQWKKMRKSGKELFGDLGLLRDCQVMVEWTERLMVPGDPVATAVLEYCRQQEAGLKQQASAALMRFDRRQWQSWARSLPRRCHRLAVGSEPFQSLALERLMQARRLHGRALRTGSPAAFHRLRIGLKKFRYVVENFLPQLHSQWADGLKRTQDALGEIHDLDVLEETSRRAGILAPAEAFKRWRERLAAERKVRIEQYTSEMTGPGSLWEVWRSGLPHGALARAAAFERLRSWAAFLDPDLAHTRLVSRLAIRLYEGLARIGLVENNQRARELLRAAAVIHELERGKRRQHRKTQRPLKKLDHPFPWTRHDLAVISFIARHHRGALPDHPQAELRGLPRPTRVLAQQLAGILRLADALDAERQGRIRSVILSKPGEFVTIHAEGLRDYSGLAERVARARHLLELSCGTPIVVRRPPRQRK